MSVRVMTLVWDSTFPTTNAKLIALKLADCANDDGANVFPSRRTVERATGCGLATIKKWLALFERAGLLVVDDRSSGGARRNTTVRRFNMKLLGALADGRMQFSATSNGNLAIVETPTGGHDVAGSPDGRATTYTERGHQIADRGPPRGPNPSCNCQGPVTRGVPRNRVLGERWAATWTPAAVQAVDRLRTADASAHVAVSFFDAVAPTLGPSAGVDAAAYVADVAERLQRYDAAVLAAVASHMKRERKMRLPAALDVEAQAARLASTYKPPPGTIRIDADDPRFAAVIARTAGNSPHYAQACQTRGFVDVHSNLLQKLEAR